MNKEMSRTSKEKKKYVYKTDIYISLSIQLFSCSFRTLWKPFGVLKTSQTHFLIESARYPGKA